VRASNLCKCVSLACRSSVWGRGQSFAAVRLGVHPFAAAAGAHFCLAFRPLECKGTQGGWLSLSHILRSSSRRGCCCCCIADRWTHTTIIMFQSSFGAFTLHTHITALKIRDQTSQYMAKKNADRPAATETLSPSSAAKHKLCDMDPPATCVCVCASEF
jgi:hypothetical protein